MSNLASVLNGASFNGLAKVDEAGLFGMITLRGDLGSAKVAAAVKGATGQDVPGVRQINGDLAGGVAWMSTDELLVLVPYADVTAKLADMLVALDGEHALAVNVSDARAVFRVSGVSAREVMGKIAPVDFSAAAFGPGDFRRSRLAQVAGAFWLDSEDSFAIVCFRSTGDYVFNLLSAAANPKSAVGVY
ncbi:sarcosine oxidase subunit gamma [Rhodobacteraceae bacterium M382]|nr:sarcosine oxidase subunit gamma [Rhodobacteraceae bacterium M382]